MISLPSAVCASLCTRAVDLRNGFHGLSGLLEECFRQDLLTGHLFLFVNRRGDRLNVLYFDHGTGTGTSWTGTGMQLRRPERVGPETAKSLWKRGRSS